MSERERLSRREVLARGAGLGLGLSLGTGSWASPGHLHLRMPALLDTTDSGRAQLTIEAGEIDFWRRGQMSATKGFNGPFLGPTLRMKAGDVALDIHNQSREATTVHWHGMLIPGAVDGGPHQMIAPGARWSPVLPVAQPAATLWYHAHPHGRTARDVYAGLAGVIHVVDGQDDARGLPHHYGEDDLTLVLQDRLFDAHGRMVYDDSMPSQMHGLHGNVVLVNGQMGAQAQVPKGLTRLRLLNGSNARIYPLAFADGRVMHLIATDGGYLPQPVALSHLLLAPGQRAEVLVDFADGHDALLRAGPTPNAGPMGGGGLDVLAMVVDHEKHARMRRVPQDLGGQLPQWQVPAQPDRVLSLDMSMGRGMGRMMQGMMGQGARFSIGGASFDMTRIDQRVRLGRIERWRITSNMMLHPFHVHGVMFQVLSIAGRAPPAQFRGWHDTVLVQGSAEIAMSFTQVADEAPPFMYHCHILEHEDGGMMGQFTVT